MWRIRLPAAAPHLFSGLKLAVAYSFIGVIAGEFILSTMGVGHEIAFAYDNFDNPRMYGLILFVLCVVTVFNLLVYRLRAATGEAARRMISPSAPCAARSWSSPSPWWRSGRCCTSSRAIPRSPPRCPPWPICGR